MSMTRGNIRLLAIKSLTNLVVQLSFQDGETADVLRGKEGDQRMGYLADVITKVVAKEMDVPTKDRRSQTIMAVRKLTGGMRAGRGGRKGEPIL